MDLAHPVAEVLHQALPEVLIGTHKCFGNEVGFKDLGLVVVDEEQRFGGKQKEHLKKLRTQVDVLTLTATPIPRTLNMSMSGVRDMSIIATPPAQLYQLRSRVGRSRERAYAYLLVPARRAVTRDAQRRLEVLQAFTELGAGFSIASHDLEIRGAGSLLGEDQSGAIAEIGFDLYTQLLEEAVAEMKGEPPPLRIEPEISLPFAALLPDDYLPDVHQRLVLYKRFSGVATEDELDDLRAELVDRYGDPPEEVDNLCELTAVKIQLRELQLRGLESGAGRLVFSLGPAALLDAGKVAALVQRSAGAYRLTPDMKLMARVPEGVKGRELAGEARAVLRELGTCAIPGR